jgi:hypothetical protein
MGTTTPNIGLYIPADGETNYGTAFANGMLNLDTHDHSGPPNKGVPLSSAGLAAGSVTADKLNANVLSPGGGLSFDINNAIQTDGVLKAIFGIGSNGLIVRTSGTTAVSRTITGTINQIDVSNGNGVSGDPTLSLSASFFTSGTYTPTVSSSAGAIAGLVYIENTGSWQRIGNWLLIDVSVLFSGTGGPAGDLRISAPFAAVGSNYYLSGLWIDQTVTQTVSANEIGSGNSYFRPWVPGGGGVPDQVPGAGAWSRNIQFTGIYRIA